MRTFKFDARRLTFYLVNILLPLILGLLLYRFLRPNAYISKIMTGLFGTPEPHILLVPGNSFVYRFVNDHVCDMLWAYSLTSALSFVQEKDKNGIILSAGISFSLETLIEFLQKFNMIHGTFDSLDILFECISSVMSVLIISLFQRRSL